MSKTANKLAIRQLPALRASLIWFKRETVRALTRRAQDSSSPAIRSAYMQKVTKIRATDLADLRLSYQADRVSEITKARRFELTQAVPGIVWVTAI